jgi:hypothetical protein
VPQIKAKETSPIQPPGFNTQLYADLNICTEKLKNDLYGDLFWDRREARYQRLSAKYRRYDTGGAKVPP